MFQRPAHMLENWEVTFAIKTAPVKGHMAGNQLDLFSISRLPFSSQEKVKSHFMVALIFH